jgi:DNA polymerase-3 subunit gamma/tau
MTLYLKYRPKNLDELDSNEARESLIQIFSSGKFPHAFLLAGPKGIGKTSAARIIAKVVNCEHLQGIKPCNKCEQCTSITKGTNLDVIEMDAASHRGIDDVRTLRDAVKLAPTKAKKKIYIIDEAHMLTTEASNALLKTLEEPPEHVVFILATTNPEKLIDTVRSRTTFIPFGKATSDEIIRSLKRVVVGEKIKIKAESLQKIAVISGGSFRDAIKILEQFTLEGEEYLKHYKNSELGNFIGFLVKKDEKLAINEIEKNVNMGISMEIFLQELLETFHLGILAESGIGEDKLEGLTIGDLIELTDLFTQANRALADSPVEELTTEIAVIKWCGEKDNRSQVDEEKAHGPEGIRPVGDESAPTVKQRELAQESAGTVNDDIWKKILSEIHPINASIEGLLRASCPVGYDGKTLTLGVFYKFHKERLEDTHHKKILEDVIEKVLNSPTRIVCILVDPPPKTAPVLTESEDNDIIKAAEEIFGN